MTACADDKWLSAKQTRAVARRLIGGGGVYSYIRVMPD